MTILLPIIIITKGVGSMKFVKQILGVGLICVSAAAVSAQMDYQFNSPAFNGAGYGTYVLNIKQLEDQAKATNKASADALAQQAQAAAANTPQAQFVANLQSRIYSQLALQITNTLYGATGQPSCGNNCGGTMSVGGNTMTWSLNSATGKINIHITNDSNPSQYTDINVPVGTFAF